MLEFAKRESRRTISDRVKHFEAALTKARMQEEKQKASFHGRPKKKQVLFYFQES